MVWISQAFHAGNFVRLWLSFLKKRYCSMETLAQTWIPLEIFLGRYLRELSNTATALLLLSIDQIKMAKPPPLPASQAQMLKVSVCPQLLKPKARTSLMDNDKYSPCAERSSERANWCSSTKQPQAVFLPSLPYSFLQLQGVESIYLEAQRINDSRASSQALDSLRNPAFFFLFFTMLTSESGLRDRPGYPGDIERRDGRVRGGQNTDHYCP